MTNTRKTLMIAAGVLIVAIGAAYLMLLRADHRTVAEATAGLAGSAQTQAADAGSSEGHTSQGAIEQSAPAAATAKPADATQQQSPAPAPANVAPAPAVAAAPAPAPVVSAPAQHPAVQPSEPTSAAVKSVNADNSPAAKTAHPAQPAQQHAAHRRDGLERRATATDATTPDTAALVRESSRLDPSLPPPTLPARTPSTDRPGSSSGANPVAAAMTDDLVKKSSHLDPALPAPADNSTTGK